VFYNQVLVQMKNNIDFRSTELEWWFVYMIWWAKKLIHDFKNTNCVNADWLNIWNDEWSYSQGQPQIKLEVLNMASKKKLITVLV